MNTHFFAPTRRGPELKIERAILRHSIELFRLQGKNVWAANSLRIGAGKPDFSIACYGPDLVRLPDVELAAARVIAFLRTTGCASVSTIASRTGETEERIRHWLCVFAEHGITENASNSVFVSARWRDILNQVITIEAKVSDWRDAARQAIRNRIFSHKSYIALPMTAAQRASGSASVRQAGIGVLGLDSAGQLQVLRAARGCRPRVWFYYYQIAFHAARCLQGYADAVFRAA